VKVHPWGRVYIDGREIGLTPLAPQEVPEGHHRVEAVMKGKRVSKEVDAPAGTSVVVKLQIPE
jgi:serine/threonine-protein kinase